MRVTKVSIIVFLLLFGIASFTERTVMWPENIQITNTFENFVTPPLNQLKLNYSFAIRYSGITIPQVTLIVVYSVNSGKIEFNRTDYEVNPDSFDYVQNLAFTSWLISLVGFSSENVSFLENSSSREIALIREEGYYIPRYINDFSAYNITGNNWTPFWVNVNDSLTKKQTGIYAYHMTMNQTVLMPAGTLPFFNESRPVVIFKNKIVLNDVDQYTNISHNIGLMYDNFTGILLKGGLTSVFSNATSSTTYQLEMKLVHTNLLEIITNLSNSTSSKDIQEFHLPPPNYLFLGLVVVTPLLFVMVRILRLKEIEGGM